MHRIFGRPIAVFTLLFAAACGGSFLLPHTVSAKTLFLAALVVFVAYVGLGMLLRDAPVKPEDAARE